MMRPYGSEDTEKGRVLIISQDLLDRLNKLLLLDESTEDMLWRITNIYSELRDNDIKKKSRK